MSFKDGVLSEQQDQFNKQLDIRYVDKNNSQIVNINKNIFKNDQPQIQTSQQNKGIQKQQNQQQSQEQNKQQDQQFSSISQIFQMGKIKQNRKISQKEQQQQYNFEIIQQGEQQQQNQYINNNNNFTGISYSSFNKQNFLQEESLEYKSFLIGGLLSQETLDKIIKLLKKVQKSK
ncbi:hypothetical protein PPERSA_11757 [Pseudocohnilembus persalinus]|uniref:Uncharacterized protein n=1 Tax=Pseudocohnilembus persalinus TaxID=266149 RepID=A0A0V0QGI5_PSEPJ|nr:hypothetical protein PPERSA_11757 [Pseudocohnilembus persalinus]|eukprot:KRX01310.1 hypothetical protein PPERSA_11757 [Pseudocohnilembus persalinus]